MSVAILHCGFMNRTKPPRNKVIAAFIRFLTARELCYDLDRARGVLRAGLEGANAKWRCMACADDAGRFVLVSIIPLKAPEPTRPACAELLTRINARLGLGHFDLDFNDGEIGFRTVVPVARKSRLRQSVIEDVIRGHHIIVNDFIPPISVASGSSNIPQPTFGPPFSPILPYKLLSGFVPARNPVLYRRRQIPRICLPPDGRMRSLHLHFLPALTMPSMIEATNLRVTYGSVDALQGVSFSVEPGQICGYLGPNGAGKSTTVKALVGLLSPTEGSVAIGGHDLALDPLAAKRLIGYVPDNAAAFTLLTVREYLDFVGELYEVEHALLRERCDRLIERLSLGECAGRRIDTLSKGQRQKTVLAAALLHDPQVLILDEPLSGLDVNAARQFKELMTGLAAQGRTIFFCSHVLEVVERICHRVIVLHEGRIVANAPTAELLATARDRKLESLFRDLTNASEDDGVEELLSALGPSQAKALAKDKR